MRSIPEVKKRAGRGIGRRRKKESGAYFANLLLRATGRGCWADKRGGHRVGLEGGGLFVGKGRNLSVGGKDGDGVRSRTTNVGGAEQGGLRTCFRH